MSIWPRIQVEGQGIHALVALGDHPDPSRAWPDALAAGQLAAHAQRPILLTRQGDVPQATQDAIVDLEVDEVTIVGGEAAIPNDTMADVGGPGTTRHRIGGVDRTDTAALLAEEAASLGAQAGDVIVATARDFPDGLAAAAAAYARDGVLLLVDRDVLSDPTRAYLEGHAPLERLSVAGGAFAVSDGVVSQMLDAAGLG